MIFWNLWHKKKHFPLYNSDARKVFLLESIISELISGMSELQDENINSFKYKVVNFLKDKSVDDSTLKYVSEISSVNVNYVSCNEFIPFKH